MLTENMTFMTVKYDFMISFDKAQGLDFQVINLMT